ncbi:MAG: hypothetical protein ACI4JD_08955 [Ruminococcus sp.]
MKKIIKILAVFSVCIISILLICTGVCAEENEYEVSDSLVSASGADNITDDLSSDVQSVLEKYDIRADNPDSVDSFGVGEILEYIYDIVTLKLASPLRTFFTLTAVIVFTAFMESSKGGLKGGTEHMSGLITAMAGAAAVIPDVCSCFLRVRETISQSSDFMTSFTPVFAGIIITSGSPGAGMCYNMTVYAVVNIIIQIIDKALLPILSMCLALSITDAVTKNGSAGGLQRFMKTIVTWTLGFLMTVFIGVLSVQGIVRGATDTFASKTAKYVVSNFVPFVGGAVSDAYGTVLGSLKILKSCTGFVGIVTLCILLLPVLLELMLYRLAVSGAAAIGEIFGADSMTRLLRGVEIALKMTFAVLVCFSVMFIVAIAVVLLMTGSGGG